MFTQCNGLTQAFVPLPDAGEAPQGASLPSSPGHDLARLWPRANKCKLRDTYALKPSLDLGFSLVTCGNERYLVSKAQRDKPGTFGSLRLSMRLRDGAPFAVKELRPRFANVRTSGKKHKVTMTPQAIADEMAFLRTSLAVEQVVWVERPASPKQPRKLTVLAFIQKMEGDLNLLKDLLERLQPPRPPATLAPFILHHVARDLQQHHAHGEVHNDIALGNVLFDRSSVRLSDFGAAQRLDPQTQTVSGSSGTFESPEMASNSACSTASDIWSLGVMISEWCVPMLETPFYELAMQKDHDDSYSLHAKKVFKEFDAFRNTLLVEGEVRLDRLDRRDGGSGVWRNYFRALRDASSTVCRLVLQYMLCPAADERLSAGAIADKITPSGRSWEIVQYLRTDSAEQQVYANFTLLRETILSQDRQRHDGSLLSASTDTTGLCLRVTPQSPKPHQNGRADYR